MSTYYPWPATLVPEVFKKIHSLSLGDCLLYQATPKGAGPRLDDRVILESDSRMGIGGMFSPIWCTSDSETAEEEFRHRHAEAIGEIWEISVTLIQCLDLAREAIRAGLGLPEGFLDEKPLFPWQFVAACIMGADIQAVRFRSFRGPGLNYAIYRASSIALVRKVKEIS